LPAESGARTLEARLQHGLHAPSIHVGWLMNGSAMLENDDAPSAGDAQDAGGNLGLAEIAAQLKALSDATFELAHKPLEEGSDPLALSKDPDAGAPLARRSPYPIGWDGESRTGARPGGTRPRRGPVGGRDAPRPRHVRGRRACVRGPGGP